MSNNIFKEGKKSKPDYLDFDKDGNKVETMKKALRDRLKVAEELKGDQHKIDVAAPYGELTSADFKKLRKGKKKVVKESLSNWREDLIEIADKIPSKDKDQKITEKQVNNKIDINPKLDLGESVENLGGILLEMVEIDEIDYVVESVYGELLDEGYEEDDIEEAIEYALTEATVTFGHDTPTGQKKKSNLLGAVGRLARQKLSSKYRGTKKAVAGAVASGARQVAKSALGVARKMEGDKKPSRVHSKSGVRSASTYSGAGAGQRERVSSGSYTPPPKTKTKTQSQKSPDPWGEPTTPPKAKAESKPKAKTTTTTVAATPSPQSDKKKKAQALRLLRQNPNISADDLRRAVGEEYEINEKTLTATETKEKERLVKSMKPKLKDFEQRYPGRGEEVLHATATKMAKRIAENFIDEAKLPSSMKKGKKKLESKTQVIHDVDDNLADQRHPDAAKIDVMRKTGGKWGKVQSLTPSQFAHHKLRKPGEPVKEENDPGDKYGFNQFRDTEKFKKTTKANKPVVRLGDSSKRPAQKSVVTARGGSEFGSKKPSTPMDKPGEFAKDLKTRIGVKNLERKNVHFTGGMRKGSGPEKKAEVVKKIVKSDAKKVITTDDHLQNVRHMAAAASEVAPKAKVRAYQSKPATKAKGKVKSGDIVPVRVGKERNLSDPKIGIRKNTSPSGSPKETQRRRKQQKMGEAVDVNQTKEKPQNPSAINQVLQAKAKADAAEKELANKQRMAAQKGVNLSSISS